MPKRKRKPKKKMGRRERLADARNWFRSRNAPKKKLVESYARRYDVSRFDAWDELVSLGYYDRIYIERYEEQGIEWEYKVEPLSGDMFVVPKGTQDHELYEIH